MIRTFFSFFKRTLTKWDLFLICFLLLSTFASFSLWFKGRPGRRVVIVVEGNQKEMVYPVDHTAQIKVEGKIGTSHIEIRDGKVRIKDSPCPNKICIKTGWIAHRGQMICCVPNGIIVTMHDGDGEKFDAQAR